MNVVSVIGEPPRRPRHGGPKTRSLPEIPKVQLKPRAPQADNMGDLTQGIELC